MKTKKQALLHSIVSLLLCVTMLVGTTFAWFTDSVTSGINMIAAGNLDVELYHSNAAVTDERVDSATELFKDLNGNEILWEPGVVSYENLRITNEGDLALTWQMTIATANENFVVDGEDRYGLSQILKVGVVEGGITATDRQSVVDSVADADWTTLADLVRSGSLPESGSSETWGIVIYWQPGDNDNLWNLNNGKQLTSGDTLQIDLGIKLVATQEVYESDSFGNDYDTDAGAFIFHDFVGGTASTNVTLDTDGKTTEEVNITSGSISATVPAGVQVAENATELTLTVTQMTASGANITLNENEDMLSLDVHIDGVADGNTTPITVVLEKAAPVGLNMGNYKLYHVENGQTIAMTEAGENPAHNQFKYDPATGDITLYMATFSEVALVADTENAWNGTFDYDWYDSSASTYTISNADQLAAFGAIVGGIVKNTTTNEYMAPDSFSGKTISLIADINLGDKENANDGLIFHPIGYSYVNGDSTVNAFSGTFDGQGHTIGNFYQNTWEIEGDYDNGYYKDAMGLFGYVSGGTVKNLTVDHFSSDGEFTPTGVIAAYADGNATFQNIAITNCNPRVYNTGNGGIIGVAGNSSGGDTITLSNITVDNSNKISALWGSWDVACGGLVGMFRGNDNGSKISFTNCHVAAQIDVYNDVCANYQYYAYRYAGMIIGSVRNNVEKDGKVLPNMEGITAIGCTVNYGDWNDYYYCELVDNTKASYTHDYQFSRLTKVDKLPESASGTAHYYVKNDDGTITCRHFIDGKLHTHSDSGTETVDGATVAVEDKTCVYLPFHQLFTGYGWGVNSVGLKEYSGIYIEGVSEGEQEESVEKFETKFTGDFLYRVGNLNEIKLGSLFAEIDEDKVNDSGVYVRIDKLYDDADVTCTFTANETDWTQGTLKFDGTGVVDIVIQDYDFCTPTVLHLEVVEAWNTTTAISAPYSKDDKKYDVVLLNSVENASNITVSDGYSFYGNGFELNYSGDGSYGSAAISYGFVTVTTGGLLDNVSVACKIFPKSYAYTSEMKADDSGRYPYGYSAIVVSGNSTISNCYVYGARNNIQVGPGNVLISNTVTECGSLANIHIKSSSGNTVTLDNLTTIQYQTTSPFDSTAKVIGFGVLVGLPDSTSNPEIKLTGNLVQHNWVTSDDTDVSNTYAKSAIKEALEVTKYQHVNSAGETTVNTGIAYLNSLDRPIDDQRSNTEIVYEEGEVCISENDGYVYSIINETGSPDAEVSGGSSTNTDIMPTVTYTGEQNDYVEMETAFDTNTERWISTLTLDLDNISGGSYDFSFSNVKVEKYGVVLNYTVKDSAGNTVDTSKTIEVSQLFNEEYTLVVSDNQIFDQNGTLTGDTVTRELPFVLYATKTSIEPPKFMGLGEGIALKTHEISGTSANWRPAYEALNNVSVTYWSVSEGKSITKVLSDLNTSGTIDGNVWTYTCDDFTLTVTGGTVHTDGSVISPIKVNDTLYFWSADKAFGTNTTTRNIILTYVFTDGNASNTETLTKQVLFDNLTYYKKSDFENGILTEGEESSTGTCLAAGTMITMADGSKKAVENMHKGDMVMSVDHMTGEVVNREVIIVIRNPGEFYKNKFIFDDGTELATINEHGVFDLDLNMYVNIDHLNYRDYIGHRFVAIDAKGNIGTKKLVSLISEWSTGYKYDIVTDQTLNYVAEDTLSVTHGLVAGSNTFEFGDNLVINHEKMQEDINKYGLYTYDDWKEYCDYNVFEQYNMAFYKVGVAKGLYTNELIIDLLQTYVYNENSQITE